MKIFILTESEDYEGTEVIGVFRKAEKAFIEQAKRAAAEATQGIYSGDKMEEWNGSSHERRYWSKKIGNHSFVVTEWEVTK